MTCITRRNLLSAIDRSSPIGTITTKMVEGLFTYDPEMRPGLCHGVKRHDGKPFTAANAFLLGIRKTRHARGHQSYAFVTGLDIPHDHTAVFRLSQPVPYLATNRSSCESPIIPRHVFQGTDISADPATAAPVGHRPFHFKDGGTATTSSLERNPDHWLSLPHPASEGCRSLRNRGISGPSLRHGTFHRLPPCLRP